MQSPNKTSTPPLSPELAALYRKLAGDFADRYVDAYLIPQLAKATKLDHTTLEDWSHALEDPLVSLKVLLGYYGFSRRGKDRDELARAALRALDRTLGDQPVETLLNATDAVPVWEAFIKECELRRLKPNESQNRGLVQGLVELAQEIYRIDETGSVAAWIADGIEQTGRLEPQFLRIVDIRGVGPKSTSTFLRDVVFIFDLEEDVQPADRIYMQPVDRWLRAISKFAVPEPDMAGAADWIVAGKINKYARRAKVSLIRFDLGLTYFGQRVVRTPDRLEQELRSLSSN